MKIGLVLEGGGMRGLYTAGVLVLRPSENISVGRLEKDVARLQALHQLGVADATRLWDDLVRYLSL